MPKKAETKPKPEAAGPAKASTSNARDFTVTLQLRHAMYVERLAQQRGETPGRVIEWCVRQEWAKDPYKAGAVSSPSSMPAQDGPKAT